MFICLYSNQNVYELCICCLFDKVIQVPACGKASQLRSQKSDKKIEKKNLSNKKVPACGTVLSLRSKNIKEENKNQEYLKNNSNKKISCVRESLFSGKQKKSIVENAVCVNHCLSVSICQE